jgi:hypothetical protein
MRNLKRPRGVLAMEPPMPRSASFPVRLLTVIALAAAAKTLPVPFSVPSHPDLSGGATTGREVAISLYQIERCVRQEQDMLLAASAPHEGVRCPISGNAV